MPVPILPPGRYSAIFGGFEIFDSGNFFGVGKFGKYFFWWLDLSSDFKFLSIKNNLKIRGRALTV